MLDNEKLQKLLALSDEELRRKVSAAAAAAGADARSTSAALSDVARLRGMLKALSAEQINGMLKSVRRRSPKSPGASKTTRSEGGAP